MANRDIGVFLRDIIKKAPKPFPYIAIFHVLWGILVLLINWGDPIDIFIVDILWIVAFSVCWFYLCDLRKWAAIGYLLLTIINIVIFVYCQTNELPQRDIYVSTLLLPALVFSFLVLFFFKRFNQ
jgi:ABC-type Na+ efflux pump permease subunit